MEKTAWKFTLRDALILMVILVVIVIFFLKLNTVNEIGRQDTKFEIVVRVEVKEDFMLDKVQVGDVVYQKGSPNVFGKVTAIKTEVALADAMELQKGEYNIDEPVPNRFNVLITFESVGNLSLNGTPIIDNKMIALNQYLVLNTNRAYLPTRVMSIVEKG